jgi:hypothetical protein
MPIHVLRTLLANAPAAARQVLLSCALLLTFFAAFASEGRAQTPDSSLSREQLEQLVAPIALYPDSLLAQILMASTYPLEIVQASRWAEGNSKLKGKPLEDALQMQPWDPSVKSIVVVPQVLQMMNDKLEWTEMLGNAFLAQQDDLLKAVQDLRARADMKGTLKTTSQQKVSRQTVTAAPDAGAPAGPATTAIVIESADPEVMYVPTYDPGVIYGDWPYPSYPPYYWYPRGYVAGNLISFGVGVAVGRAIWGNCNWGRNQVNVNVNNFNSFNRTNISNGSWQHNADHRKGVPYANSNVAERFGQKGAGASAARDQFRGRTEGGQLGNQGRPGGQTPGQGVGDRTPGAGQGARPGQTPAQGAVKNAGAGGAKDTAKNAKNAKNAGAGSAKNTAKNNAGGGGGKNRPSGGGGGGGAGATALDGVGRGQSVRQESARGASSRNAMASARPSPSVSRPSPGGGGGGGGMRGGGGGGGGRGGGGGGGRRSDLMLKHDIILLGHLDNGLGFYRFSYNGSDKAYVGVIAQEVQAVMPQAVVRGRDGYLRVFYDKLGVTFETYDRWIASGAHVPTAAGWVLH